MAARPKITPNKVEQVIAALRIGADIAGAAHLIAVSEDGLTKYLARHPLVKVRADEARKIADDRVQSALYKSAINGNVTAMIFWLKNRQSAAWRDRRELALGDLSVSDAIAQAHEAATKSEDPEAQ